MDCWTAISPGHYGHGLANYFRIQWVNICNNFQHHSDVSCTTGLWPKLTKFICERMQDWWEIGKFHCRKSAQSQILNRLDVYLQEDLLRYSLLGRKKSMMHLKNIQCIHKQINNQAWQETSSLIAECFSHGMRLQMDFMCAQIDHQQQEESRCIHDNMKIS